MEDNNIKTGLNGEMLFYTANRFKDLFVVISMGIGLLFFFSFIYFGIVPSGIGYILFGFFIMLELPWMILFLIHFLKNPPVFIITEQGIEAENSIFGSVYMAWQQIDTIDMPRPNVLIFKTKDNKVHRIFYSLSKENQEVLKKIFAEHGFIFN